MDRRSLIKNAGIAGVLAVVMVAALVYLMVLIARSQH